MTSERVGSNVQKKKGDIEKKDERIELNWIEGVEKEKKKEKEEKEEKGGNPTTKIY